MTAFLILLPIVNAAIAIPLAYALGFSQGDAFLFTILCARASHNAVPAAATHEARKFNYKHYIRRTHRYLGVFIGIQFILWTLGGLYFSRTDLDEIHGDHLKGNSPSEFSLPEGAASPDMIIKSVRSTFGTTRIEKMYFVAVLGSYFYAVEHVIDGKRETVLLSVGDALVRSAVSSTEARQIAKDALASQSEPVGLSYLTTDDVSKHYEYREKPLPAWAASFENNVNVYLSAETGQIIEIQTNKWRIFDFL